MAYTFLLNQRPATAGEAFYMIKEFMKTIGWTIESSGTGDSGGVMGAGDNLTLTVFNTAIRYWWRAKWPGVGDEFVILINDTYQGLIEYSRSAGFTTGGTGSSPPTASDGLRFYGVGYNIGSGDDILGIDTDTLQFVGNTETGEFLVVGHSDNTAYFYNPSTKWFLDRLVPGSFSSADPCPIVFSATGSATGSSRFTASYMTQDSGLCAMSRGPDGLPWAVQGIPLGKDTSSNFTVPGGGVAYAHGGEEMMYPFYWGKESLLYSKPTYKGRSSWFKWISRGSGAITGTWATLNSPKDHLIVGTVLIPWDGSTEMTNAQASYTRYGIDAVRGIELLQSTSASQPTHISGPTFDATSEARYFDGGDFLPGPVATSMDLAMAQGQWTLEAFIRPAGPTAASRRDIIAIAGDDADDASAATNIQFTLSITTTGYLQVIWEQGATGVNVVHTSTTALISTAWVYVAAVKNATHIRFYIDGVFQDQIARGTNATGGTSANWVIGSADIGGAAFMIGRMKSIRVSHRARTDAEITTAATYLAGGQSLPIDEATYALWRLERIETVQVGRYTDAHPTDLGGVYTITGTLSGYEGDGSGIEVISWDTVTGKKDGAAITAVGGTYTISVPTNNPHFTEARVSDTRHGRSDNVIPS